MSKCYFIWNQEIHMLKDSGPIGLSLMVVMAEGFLQVLEAKAIDEALHMQPSIAPLTHFRYVDDSHTRFEEDDHSDTFLGVLNRQNRHVQYTMEKENERKELAYLERRTKNTRTGKYEFDVYRKNAITNVQIKPDSCHDPKVLRGIFKGFLNRAIRICSKKYLDKEIDFLKNIFEENGYKEEELQKMIAEVKSKQMRDTNAGTMEETGQATNDTANRETITLPWIPGISPRLKKAYRKAGYKVAFRSGQSIGSILTTRNKSKLPPNSRPGVYEVPCSCKIPAYRGETKKRVSTRLGEHRTYIEKAEWKKSGVALHSNQCSGKIEFEKAKTVAVINNKFERKIRETLEIQKHDCFKDDGGMNPDRGKYVTTKFWYPLLKYLKKTEKNKSTNGNDVS